MRKKETTYTTICDICGKEEKTNNEDRSFEHRYHRFILLKDYHFNIDTIVDSNVGGRLYEDIDICQDCFIKALECFIEDLKKQKDTRR